MKIVIPGIPIAKARHRDGIKYGKRIKYDPQQKEKQATRKWINRYIQQVFETGTAVQVLEASDLTSAESFTFDVTFYMPIAKSDTEAVKNAKLWGFIPHTQKPDASNLLKFYEDAANMLLYKDDSQLVHVSAKKKWSDQPRTEITIMPIKTTTADEVHILSHFSPEELYNLANIFMRLPRITGICSWDDLIKEDSNRKQASAILSEIADKYASKLQKISKKCPGYWQRTTK